MSSRSIGHNRSDSRISFTPGAANEATAREIERRRNARVALRGEIGQQYATLQALHQATAQQPMNPILGISGMILTRVADGVGALASTVEGAVNTVASGLGATKEIHLSTGKVRGFLRNQALSRLMNSGGLKVQDTEESQSTHLDKRVYEPLRIGDIVCFSPATADDPLSSVMVADGFQALRCGVTTSDRVQPCVPNVDRACFRIWSAGSASMIPPAGLAQSAGAGPVTDDQLGATVSYGMPIVLEHVLSGQFLAASPRELADVEKECTKLLLVLNGSSPACLFEFKPLLKSRANGEVYLHDEVSLMNMRLDLMLHQAPTDSVYNAQANNPLIEVNLASEQETGTGCYAWKMHKFATHCHHAHDHLQIGQPVRIYHPELGMLACIRKESADQDTRDSFRFVSSHDKKAATDASTIFVIEKPAGETGGEVLWQHSYRLRHLVTGHYLTVDSAAGLGTKPFNTLLSDTRNVESESQVQNFLASLFQFIPTKLLSNSKCIPKTDNTMHLQHTGSSKKKKKNKKQQQQQKHHEHDLDDSSDDERESTRLKCYMAAGDAMASQSLAVLFDLVGGAPLRVQLPEEDRVASASTRSLVFSKTPHEHDVVQLQPVSALEYQAVLFCLQCKDVADLYQNALVDLVQRRRRGQMVSLATDTSRRTIAMLNDLSTFLSCPTTAEHAGLVLSATQPDTAAQQVELRQTAQRIVMQSGLLDELFQLLKAPKLAGLSWSEVNSDENMASIHRAVARAINHTAESNAQVQYYVARSQFHQIAAADTEGRIKKRESFGYLAEVFDQLPFGVGASGLLQTLLTGNAYLLSALVDDEVISQIILLLRQRGPARPILDLLASMCRCQGETVIANQERLMRIVYSITENQHHIQYRRAMLIETMLLPPSAAGRAGEASVLISWQGSSNYEPGALEITALYHDAHTLGLATVQVDENPPELQAYLQRAHAANVARKWVALEDIAWTLDPAHTYPRRKRWSLPPTWREYQALCERDPAMKQQFQHWHAIANYYLGVLNLLHEFCANRSYKCIDLLDKQFSFDTLLAGIADRRLPLVFRTHFAKLLFALYVDRYPNEKLQFPSYLRFHPLGFVDEEEKRQPTGASKSDPERERITTRLHTLIDFISQYFETESDRNASARCGTEMDEHHFAHSLLHIGHYLMSMGLYTASNKLTRHMELLGRVLSQYCRKQAETRAERMSQLTPKAGDDIGRPSEQKGDSTLGADGDTTADQHLEEKDDYPDEAGGTTGLMMQSLRGQADGTGASSPAEESKDSASTAPTSPQASSSEKISLCEDLQRICHIHDSLVQQDVESDQVWENQRWRPAALWSAESSVGARGEWSYHKHLRDVFVNGSSPRAEPNGTAGIRDLTWEWVSPWAVQPLSAAVVSEDPDGWIYAFNWPTDDTGYSPQSGAHMWVRRRLWERQRRRRRAEDLAKVLLRQGRAEKHVLRAFQAASNDGGVIDLLKALSILPTLEKQQQTKQTDATFAVTATFEADSQQDTGKTASAQQQCVAVALASLSTIFEIITDVRLSSFAREYVSIIDKSALLHGNALSQMGRNLALVTMDAEQLEGVELSGPVLKQLVNLLVLLSGDENSQICDQATRVLTLYFNRNKEFLHAAEELDILIEPYALELSNTITEALAVLKSRIGRVFHGGHGSVEASEEEAMYLQVVAAHFKALTKILQGSDELNRRLALSIAQKLGAHRVALATIYHATKDDRVAPQLMVDLRRAASNCLEEFVRDYAPNQARLAEFVPMLLPALDLNVGVPKVIASVYKDNLELCHAIPESLIQTYCAKIEQHGVELGQLWSFTDLLEYVMVVRGVPVRRSQNIVAKALLDRSYTQVCVTFCEPADASDPKSSVGFTRRRELLRGYDATFEDPSARTLRYHARCIRLLAICCLGKHTANELKCRMRVPFEVVAEVLQDSKTFACPEVATAFAKFLFTVYLETDADPKAILSGYDTINITNHPLMWGCMATFARAILKYAKSGTDLLENFVFDGALPCIDLLFRKIVSVQAVLQDAARNAGMNDNHPSVAASNAVEVIRSSLQAVAENRSLSPTQFLLLTNAAKAVGLDTGDAWKNVQVKEEHSISESDMHRMQLQDESFNAYQSFVKALCTDGKLQDLVHVHFRELAVITSNIASLEIQTAAGRVASSLTSEAIVRRMIKAARERAVLDPSQQTLQLEMLLDRGAYHLVKESHTMLLRLLTALLRGTVAAGHGSRRILEQVAATTTPAEMRLTMVLGGAAQLLVELIANSNEEELLQAALEFGIALLESGDRRVQDALLAYLRQTMNYRFFAWFNSRLLDISQALRSWHRWREFQLMNAAASSADDHIGGTAGGDLQVGVALRTTMMRLHLQDMLRFLQLVCEGHNTEMQLLMQSQPGFAVSQDLVSTVADVLSDVVPNVEVLDMFEGAELHTIIQVLEYLIEVIQGPCRENQALLATTPAIQAAYTIIKWAPDVQGAHLLPRFTLKASAATFLYSLIEGRVATEEDAVFSGLFKVIEASQVAESIHRIYRNMKHTRTNEELCSQVQAEGFLLMSLARQMGQARPTLLESLTPRIMAPGKKERYDSLSDFEKARAEYHKQEKYRVAYDFINERLRTVEVVWGDNGLVRVHYMQPRLCDFLTEETKEQTKQAIDYSDDDRVKNLLKTADTLFDDMSHKMMLASNPLSAAFMTMLDEVDYVTICLAVLINFLLVISLRYEDGDPAFYPDYFGVIVRVLGVLQVCLTGLRLVQSAVVSGPLIVSAAYRRRWELNIIQRKAPPIGAHQAVKAVAECFRHFISALVAAICGGIFLELRYHEVAGGFIGFAVAVVALTFLRGMAKLGELPLLSGSHALTVWIVAHKFLVDQRVRHKILFFLAAILAVCTEPYFYSIQLLVLVQLSETLHNVVKAITMPAVALGMSALLAGICIYIFAFFGFWFFQDAFENGDQNINECSSLLMCLSSFLHNGLIFGGGIADYVNNELGNPADLRDDHEYSTRLFYDLLYFVTIIVLALNMIFGIILDTFGQLREEATERRSLMENFCFVCQLPKEDFDEHIRTTTARSGSGFAYHVKHEHNMWDYLCFLIYLKDKDPMDYNGVESYVAECLEQDDFSWVPHGQALSIPTDNTVAEEHARRDNLLLQITAAVSQHSAEMEATILQHISSLKHEQNSLKRALARVQGELATLSQSSRNDRQGGRS